MNYALSELEARHHRKELAIMERMEQLELARRQLGLSWADLGESDNYLRCAEAGTIQPSITVSSLSPEQMQGMLNTKVLLWRLGAGDSNATYITFLNSRLVSSISNNIANRFLVRWWPRTYFWVGSLSFSVLAGKIMFQDILFLTPDWSFRSQDGYIIFCWWRSYVPEVRVWREFDTLANFNYTWTGCF